ncbi:hypothetical protein HDV05_008384, partial [Chytridiales sp. JEL 0842]
MAEMADSEARVLEIPMSEQEKNDEIFVAIVKALLLVANIPMSCQQLAEFIAKENLIAKEQKKVETALQMRLKNYIEQNGSILRRQQARGNAEQRGGKTPYYYYLDVPGLFKPSATFFNNFDWCIKTLASNFGIIPPPPDPPTNDEIQISTQSQPAEPVVSEEASASTSVNVPETTPQKDDAEPEAPPKKFGKFISDIWVIPKLHTRHPRSRGGRKPKQYGQSTALVRIAKETSSNKKRASPSDTDLEEQSARSKKKVKAIDGVIVSSGSISMSNTATKYNRRSAEQIAISKLTKNDKIPARMKAPPGAKIQDDYCKRGDYVNFPHCQSCHYGKSMFDNCQFIGFRAFKVSQDGALIDGPYFVPGGKDIPRPARTHVSNRQVVLQSKATNSALPKPIIEEEPDMFDAPVTPLSDAVSVEVVSTKPKKKRGRKPKASYVAESDVEDLEDDDADEVPEYIYFTKETDIPESMRLPEGSRSLVQHYYCSRDRYVDFVACYPCQKKMPIQANCQFIGFRAFLVRDDGSLEDGPYFVPGGTDMERPVAKRGPQRRVTSASLALVPFFANQAQASSAASTPAGPTEM